MWREEFKGLTTAQKLLLLICGLVISFGGRAMVLWILGML
jgi:hypothetical protein